MDITRLSEEYLLIMDLPIDGKYSEDECLWIIEKKENWILDDQRNFLHFGNAGFDGVEFGLRSNVIGVWAYYPIEARYLKIAVSIVEFINDWNSGRIEL